MRRQLRNRTLWASYVIVIILAVVIAIVDLAGDRPRNLGIENGKLADYPASPNCISSQAENPRQSIAPLTYAGATSEAIRGLNELALSMNGTTLVTEKVNYLHIEFKIPVLGFVDDVEFYFDEADHTIQMRSASRTGYWDLGVNRRRLKAVTRSWVARSAGLDKP